MKPKKPLPEFTLEELHESEVSLARLVESTRVLLTGLDECPEMLSWFEMHLASHELPNPLGLGFRDLTESNLGEFINLYQDVVAELERRK